MNDQSNIEGKKMIKYDLKTHISVKDICDTSDDYYLEYNVQGKANNKYFLGIPLLVFDAGKYYPVFGKKYINHNIQKHQSLQYSFVVEKAGTPCEVLNNLILLTQEMKGFNVIEKGITLQKMYDIDEKVDNSLLNILGIPKNESYVRGYLTLATAPESIKELVLKVCKNITASTSKTDQ